MLLYPDAFQYKQPPYEYEYERLPMNLILGDPAVRISLEEGTAVQAIEEMWETDLTGFDLRRKQAFLYD
jgi:uncharacterized protein YbbC (DUF1343 family)